MNETPAGGKSPKLSYSGAGFKLTLVGVRSSPTPGKAGNEGDPGGDHIGTPDLQQGCCSLK